MGKYKVIKKLGQGSYGTVYLVQDSKDSQYFVMKKITVSGMSEQELSDCKREIQILSVMKHPNIVRYKRSFVRRGALCIVMEYADGGDLHHMIRAQRHAGKHFSEDQILNWLTQACLGLEHVHHHKILHRDLKTQNIFLTAKGEVKLGDFGISRVLKNTMDQAHTLVGTPYYLSPEMVNGQAYDHRSDIWSMGVVLYEMLTLQHPFNADSLQMLALKIIQGNYPPIPKQYSKEMNDLLSRMLEQDAKKRLDIIGVLKTPIVMERVKTYAPDHHIFGGEAPPAPEEMKFEEPDFEDEEKSPKAAAAKLAPELDGTKPIPKAHKSKLPPVPPGKEKGESSVSSLSSKGEPSYSEKSESVKSDKVTKAAAVPKPTAPTGPAPPPGAKRPAPPAPAKGAVKKDEKGHARKGSIDVKAEMADDEPDWEIGDSVAGDAAPLPPPSAAPYAEPSVARNTQVDILRSYLEERLGPARLRKIVECLTSGADDETKHATIEKLTKGHSGLLPIVHTLVYLSQAAGVSPFSK